MGINVNIINQLKVVEIIFNDEKGLKYTQMLFNASNDHITTSFLPTCLCLIHHYNNSIHLNSCRLNFFANSIHVFLNNGKDCSWMQNILCVKECDVKSNKYQIYHFPIPQIFHFFRLLCQYCSHCIMWIWDNFFGFPKWNWNFVHTVLY